MKLGFVTNIANPYNDALFRALRRLGHDVQVLYARTPSAEGRLWEIGVHESESVVRGVRRGLSAVKGLVRSVDALVVSGSYLDLLALESLVAVRRLDCPLLFWGERLRPSARAHLLRRAVFSRVDAVLTVGRWSQWSYAKVVPQGCHLWNFPYVCETPPVVGRVSGEQIVGFAGALVRRKGLDLVIDALACMAGSERPVLEVAGSGPELRELSAQAEERNVKVRLLGFLQPDELRHRQAAWTVHVVPSRYDGWGVVVNEALAAGTAVVASAHTGAAFDTVRHGFNGWIVHREADWKSALGDAVARAESGALSAAARNVGRALTADAAAAWLVDTIQGQPVAADFVRDAFERSGQLDEWHRFLSTPRAGHGPSDPAWRVAYFGAPVEVPPWEMVAACMDPTVEGVRSGRAAGCSEWSLSRGTFEGLQPDAQESVLSGRPPDGIAWVSPSGRHRRRNV